MNEEITKIVITKKGDGYSLSGWRLGTCVFMRQLSREEFSVSLEDQTALISFADFDFSDQNVFLNMFEQT